MTQIKPVLSLEILVRLVATLRAGEPSSTRRQLLDTVHFSLQRMLEIESERRTP
jgi:hypothetical protein